MTMAGTAFRFERLQGDLEEMRRIKCPMLDWRADGQPPERYVVEYQLQSFVGPGPSRDLHQVLFELGPEYPDRAPSVSMLDKPPVFHPNIFPDGRICIAPTAWTPEEGLGFLVIRVARMLLFASDVTNPSSAANPAAATWYVTNPQRFPLDCGVVFPDPITGICGERPRLVIRRVEP